MTGRKVLAIESSEAAMGSAMIASWGSGGVTSLAEIAKNVVGVRRSFEPHLDSTRIYAEIRERLDAITNDIYGSKIGTP